MAEQTQFLKNFIPKLQIYEPSKDVFDALFMNPLYYYSDETSEWLTENREKYAKALLYLHTLPFQYSKLQTGDIRSFFNDKTEKDTETAHGGLEVVPYGFLVFLGGLIWRKRWYTVWNQDPFLLGNFRDYKPTESGYDPLLVSIDDSVRFCVIPLTTTANVKYLKYNDIVNEDMDIYTENALHNLFIQFVNNVFIDKIKPLCELKYRTIVQEDDNTDETEPETETEGETETSADNETEVEPEPEPELTYPTVQDQSNHSDMHNFNDETITALRIALHNKQNSIGGMLEILTGVACFKEDENGTQYYVSNFAPNYSMGFYCTDNSWKLYFSENNKIHEYFTELYANNSVAIRIGYNSKSAAECHRKITDSIFKSYLNGLCNVLETKRSYDAKNNNLKARNNETERLSDRDLKCAIYMELKNLWDRWLCGYYNQDREEYFNVKEKGKDNNWQNTLFGNFVFIDSFYRDISYMLKLNCNKLAVLGKSDVMYQSDGGTNRVSTHLGNVVSEHKCIMYNFPDYVGFDGNAEHAIDLMENLFKPLPVSKIPEPSVMNKFVIIYANGAQMLNSKDRNNFNNDSFNIYSYKDGTKVAPVAFSQKKMFADQGTGQMGYLVPSFCVEYSRQNNSYWTNIGINTSSHANTEVAAMAMANIAEKGNSSKRQICFYGQDVYPIYQAYSYMVTIEMLGNAQIQPLMYFQLLNIPMFTGAYMVINVEHNISPGMMKTTVTGMRMTKVQPPYTKAWFTIPDEGKVEVERGEDFVGNGEELITNNSTTLDIADDNLSKAINDTLDNSPMLCDTFVRRVYGHDLVRVGINHNLQPGADGIDMLKELMENPDDWDVHEFKRTTKPSKQNNWEPLYATTRPHPVCGDLLFGYHGSVLYSENQPFHHVALYLGLAAKDSSDVYVAEGTSVSGGPIQEGNAGKVQICSIQDSRMGLATDVITHWAHCKKYEVIQKDGDTNEEFQYRIVPSSVVDDVSDVVTPDNAIEAVEQPEQTQTEVHMSENTSPQSSFSIQSIEPPRQQQESPQQAQFTPTPEKRESLYTTQVLNPKKEKLSGQVKNNLKNLIDDILDPVTYACIERYGGDDPVMRKQPHVNSGYRSKKTNDETTGASQTSQHMYGQAADMDYKGRDDKNGLRNLKFAREVIRNGVWDQLIIENPVKFNRNDKDATHTDFRCGWVHVSHNRNNPRHKITVNINHVHQLTITPAMFSNGLQGVVDWFMERYRVVVPDGD